MRRLETAFATLLWGCAIVYSLYSLYLYSKNLNCHITDYHYEDFSRGWFGRYEDISDFEWNCWTRLTWQLTPWLVVNLLTSIVGRTFKCSDDIIVVPLCQSLISLVAISHILSPASAGLFSLIIFSFHIVTYLQMPALIYILAWAWRRFIPSSYLAQDDDSFYLIEVAASWFIIRCLIYSMEVIRGSKKSLSMLMSYALYLPTAFCGPILSFSCFVRNTMRPPEKRLNWNIFLKAMLLFMRCLAWFLFTSLALHFVYPNAILLRPYMVVGMTLWQLAGLGIAMGHFFHLKYVVFYGMPSAWASADGISPPPSPCCVSRVSCYSVMWRRFDPGLYAFLLRYIYVPILQTFQDCRLVSKTLASVACFFFVYVWHGEQMYVLYWVVLNFTAVTIEGLAKELNRLPAVRSKLDQTLSADNQRRLQCLLAAPLHYFSMLSNYFFIGSMDIGKIYFQRALRETAINNIYILIFLYGAAQSSLSIEERDKEDKIRRHTSSKNKDCAK